MFGSVQPQPLNNQPDGTILLDDIENAIKPDDAHFACSRLLCLENTMGGKLLPMDYILKATRLARGRGLMTHLDGARLFNAAVAQADLLGTDARTEARRIAQCFDSVSVCFSKGLGTPVGSALCGSKDFIARAHRIRKMAGGGMRQAGMIAGAALHALDHHVDRLAKDHALAKRLAEGLSHVLALRLVAPPQTNMVFLDPVGSARQRVAALVDHMAVHGVRVLGSLPLRFVTHLNVDEQGIDRTVALIREFFSLEPQA